MNKTEDITEEECEEHCVGRDHPKCKGCWVDNQADLKSFVIDGVKIKKKKSD